MNVEQAIARAQSVVGQPCKYKLGEGGRLWHKDTPWNPHAMACDCSGFVAWCLGMDRHTADPAYKKWNGGWIETTAIARDAHLEPGVGLFDELPQPQVGALYVYPDRRVEGKVRQGHVGIIVGLDPVRVVHCSAGNYRRVGYAIAETDDGLWQRRSDAVVAACTLIEEFSGTGRG